MTDKTKESTVKQVKGQSSPTVKELHTARLQRLVDLEHSSSVEEIVERMEGE